MWSSSQPSRRGRRMSLELPHPPIPLTAKDSEFLQRRPELFFPYLQTPFSSANTSTVSGFFPSIFTLFVSYKSLKSIFWIYYLNIQ
jgi:hypothetical protein